MADHGNIHDNVNHPAHYEARNMECIDEMIAIFGERSTYEFCRLNAWKYRYRADLKGQHDEDMAKADWYIKKAAELKRRIWGASAENHGPGTSSFPGNQQRR